MRRRSASSSPGWASPWPESWSRTPTTTTSGQSPSWPKGPGRPSTSPRWRRPCSPSRPTTTRATGFGRGRRRCSSPETRRSKPQGSRSRRCKFPAIPRVTLRSTPTSASFRGTSSSPARSDGPTCRWRAGRRSSSRSGPSSTGSHPRRSSIPATGRRRPSAPSSRETRSSPSSVPSFEAPRGTHDILPSEQPAWQFVKQEFERLCVLYGYRRIDTPIFEDTDLFARTSGEGSDIVTKEMYTFTDRGDRSLTLRPEATAPIVRAYLEHGLHREPQPQKLYAIETFYRYGRPQKGRYREFWQLDLEA